MLSLEHGQDSRGLEFPTGSEDGSDTMSELSRSRISRFFVGLAIESGSVGCHGTDSVRAMK